MRNFILICLGLLITACSSGPKEINYGQDKCDYCTMTITDKRYGAELVTSKGKVYKFDATECMLAYMKDHAETQFSHHLTATLDKPASLQDATTASFLISPNLPSPMGANITAFSTIDLAKNAQEEHMGDLFTFDEIYNWYKDNQHKQPGHMHDLEHE